MPEAEIRLGKDRFPILDLFGRKRSSKGRVQKSRAKAWFGFLRGRVSWRSTACRIPLLHLANHEKPKSREENQGSQIEDPVRPTLFRNYYSANLAAGNSRQKIGITYFGNRLSGTAAPNHLPQKECAHDNYCPENDSSHNAVHIEPAYVVAARYGRFRPVCSGLPRP